jgi:hypothetical protein
MADGRFVARRRAGKVWVCGHQEKHLSRLTVGSHCDGWKLCRFRRTQWQNPPGELRSQLR